MRADDGAFAEGRGCYTSVRIAGRRPRFAERHAARLVRGARALRLGELDPRRVHRALAELGGAAFADGEGIVRLQLSRDGAGALHLVGVPRGLGSDPSEWTAIAAPLAHEHPVVAGGHKLTQRLLHALAADAAREAGADEALLFDRAGRLVEGARSNVVVVRCDGLLATPPLERGAVAGVALEVLAERVAELRPRDLSARELWRAREVLVVNSVRGVRPLVRLDGRPLGRGDRTWARRLARALEDEASGARLPEPCSTLARPRGGGR